MPDDLGEVEARVMVRVREERRRFREDPVYREMVRRLLEDRSFKPRVVFVP